LQDREPGAEQSSSVRSPTGILNARGASDLPQDDRVREKLAALATRLEAIALRIRTLGLVRAAEDLVHVSAELRKLSVGEPERSP
jgi:hypothetical protein